MQNDYTTRFLNLRGVRLIDYTVTNKAHIFTLELKNSRVKECPHCGHKGLHYHDRRLQVIRHVPYDLRPVHLHLQRIRYKCPCCGHYAEKEPRFVEPKSQLSNQLKRWIIKCNARMMPYTEIARISDVSITTVRRILERLTPKRKPMPRVFCIDEFKGDSGGEKYQTSLGDGENHELIDILPSRRKAFLVGYFSQIPKEEREKVEYFVSDMSVTFKEIHDEFFPNSIYVIDRYHFVRQAHWALENIRIREQKAMTKKERLYYKRSRKLLHKRLKDLTEPEMLRVAEMLRRNEAIRMAYFLKEAFHTFVLCQEGKEESLEALKAWVESAQAAGDPEWANCIRALTNWAEPIAHSIYLPWSNGYLEGCHNKIKTLKRVSFGMPNFHHFRTKILCLFGNKEEIA